MGSQAALPEMNLSIFSETEMGPEVKWLSYEALTLCRIKLSVCPALGRSKLSKFFYQHNESSCKHLIINANNKTTHFLRNWISKKCFFVGNTVCLSEIWTQNFFKAIESKKFSINMNTFCVSVSENSRKSQQFLLFHFLSRRFRLYHVCLPSAELFAFDSENRNTDCVKNWQILELKKWDFYLLLQK